MKWPSWLDDALFVFVIVVGAAVARLVARYSEAWP